MAAVLRGGTVPGHPYFLLRTAADSIILLLDGAETTLVCGVRPKYQVPQICNALENAVRAGGRFAAAHPDTGADPGHPDQGDDRDVPP
jgi:hypothetical protein